ncbi:MAG TPA: hypothetical protein VMT79_09925 [Candidatus Binatia bacterium]|nr:hypothetical protein [Candidatus Binatia bacterium]
MPEWIRPRGHDVAVLFSRRSRDAYAAAAAAGAETYAFTDAWGRPCTWLKGEYAYLAPNAASLLLARCNLKHDVVEEADLTDERLAGYRALLVPNAGHLTDATVGRLGSWLGGADRRLIATGKTNLPPHLLGLDAAAPVPVAGYTGWRWLPGSPFAGPAWPDLCVTGYRGHLVHRVVPAPGSRVLAELVELTGDLTSAASATVSTLGPAIVGTERTSYVANQVFELLGGMLQAHLNVEAVRHWANPTHWGDTILFFLRRLLRDLGLDHLWTTRLRSFGASAGVLSFRHDVHGMLDFSLLDYQIQNLIPATYDIEDPGFSTNISEAMAAEWVTRTSQHGFIEPALHNDSSIGDPPTAVHGAGLHTHVRNAAERLGFPVYTCGRHAGGHMHPETIDAMDYLYAHDDRILGTCTFCYYHMIEYGVRDPDVVVGGAIGGKPLTYATDVRRTIATPGIWFPFHPVVTSAAEWRPLRGWDRTHEYDAAYELVETIYGGHGARGDGVDDHLENGVYSFQYHPELARDPSVNDGKGTLDYVRYAINLAERHDFWIANQRELYQRMDDYEALVFQVRDDGREVRVANPTGRRIAAMVVEQRRPFASVWDGAIELVHVVRDAFVTVPPLGPGAEVVLRFSAGETEAPLLRQPSNKGLTVLAARHDPRSGETSIAVSVCRLQPLAVEGVDAEGAYRVQVDGERPRHVVPRVARTIQAVLSTQGPRDAAAGRRARRPGVTTFLDLSIAGAENHFVERTVRIAALPPGEAAAARATLQAAVPARTGRVT